MQLREHVKAPKRYEDELNEEGRFNLISPKRSSHNSSPQATPSGSKIKASHHAHEINNNLIHHTQQKRSKAPTPRSSQKQQTSSQRRTPPSRNKNPKASDLDTTLAILRIGTQQPDMAPTTANGGFHMSNGPGNPVWEGNMATMKELGDRTDEDWFNAEAGTSDEDESVPRTPSGRKMNGKNAGVTRCPIWEDIPLRLRIDMVHEASGKDTAVGPALQRLRLSPLQGAAMQEALRAHYKQRKQDEKNEKDKIQQHQQRTTEMLLSNPGNTHVFDQAFRALLDDGLYKDVDGGASKLVKRKDVDNARAYMRFCGLDPSFLNHCAVAPDSPEFMTNEELAQELDGLTEKESDGEQATGNANSNGTAENGHTSSLPPPHTPPPLPRTPDIVNTIHLTPAPPVPLAPWPASSPPTPSANGMRSQIVPSNATASSSSPSATPTAAHVNKKRRLEPAASSSNGTRRVESAAAASSANGIRHKAAKPAPVVKSKGAMAGGRGVGNGEEKSRGRGKGNEGEEEKKKRGK
ncbi:MAG: hypothetical protein Q9220_003370 [cf. Caloplaca sp. 1 TL-2023]